MWQVKLKVLCQRVMTSILCCCVTDVVVRVVVNMLPS